MHCVQFGSPSPRRLLVRTHRLAEVLALEVLADRQHPDLERPLPEVQRQRPTAPHDLLDVPVTHVLIQRMWTFEMYLIVSYSFSHSS